MKKNNKALLVTLSAVVLVIATVFGTMAYFTDQEAVTNTFTIGQVDITLDELDTDQDDNKKDNKDYTVDGETVTRDKANKYHLIPGQTYVKDPTVHVQKGSEDCYVFVTVDNQIADIEWDDDGYNSIVTQMSMNGWKLLSKADAGSIEFVQKNGLNVFVYSGDKAENDVVPKNEDANTDLVVFSKFRIDGDSVISRHEQTGAAPDGFYYIDDYKTVGEDGTAIVVTAYSVQADGFNSALDAWEAANGQFN